MCIISRQPWTVWRLDTPSKGVFFACGKWPIQVGRRPISIIVTQKRGPVEAPSQYLLRDHQARAQRTWQITPWLTEVLCVCVCAMSLQLCLTLCDPRDCSLPGSSVHGIFWARILEWVAMGLTFPSPGNLANPRIKPVPLTSPPSAAVFFTAQAIWEAPKEFQATLNSITALSRSEVFANSSGLL